MWNYIKLARKYGVIVSAEVPEDTIYVWRDTQLIEVNPKKYNEIYIVKHSLLFNAMFPVDDDEEK